LGFGENHIEAIKLRWEAGTRTIPTGGFSLGFFVQKACVHFCHSLKNTAPHEDFLKQVATARKTPERLLLSRG